MADAMKVRAQAKGDYAEIKILMTHPMETGRRKDGDGKLVPAHHIRNVTISVNSKVVMQTQWGTAISKNPFLGLRVRGAKSGDKLTVHWVDTQGDENSIEASIA